MKKNTLLSGTLILLVGGILAKLFSAIYRIFLTRILGAEGIGLYQLIFPIYSLCVVLATAGLPMAISKVVSKNEGAEKQVVKKCVLFVLLMGFIISLSLIVLSMALATLQGRKEIWILYIMLAPTILFVAISSVLRGYFQGISNCSPSAISNILEQFIKLCFGLALSLILIQKGLFFGVLGAVLGIIIGEIVSFVVLILYYKKSVKFYSKEIKLELSFKSLVKDILPISLTNIVLPLIGFIDSILVVNLLKINFNIDMAIYLYGIESGAVSSLVSLPTIFSFAIASAIMPTMSNKDKIYNKSRKLDFSLKIILAICIPCVLCFVFFPSYIINILYGERLSGFGISGNYIAAKLLTLSSFGIIGLIINQIYSTSLQALNCRRKTVENLLIAVVVKLVLEIVLLPIVEINIYALAISNTVCYLLVMMLNHFQIVKYIKLEVDYKFFSKLIVCNFVMILVVVCVLISSSSVLNSILAFIYGAIAYLGSLIIFKIFSRKDIAHIKYKK